MQPYTIPLYALTHRAELVSSEQFQRTVSTVPFMTLNGKSHLQRQAAIFGANRIVILAIFDECRVNLPLFLFQPLGIATVDSHWLKQFCFWGSHYCHPLSSAFRTDLWHTGLGCSRLPHEATDLGLSDIEGVAGTAHRSNTRRTVRLLHLNVLDGVELI